MASMAFTLTSLASAATASFTSHIPPPALPLPPNPIKELSLMTSPEERGLHLGRRGLLYSACRLAALSSLSLSKPAAKAAILEADDDVELLERVKKDRQKRIQRQEVISSSKKETGYLQDLVYKLSKVGQAIENNDFSAAGTVLGQSTETDWLKNVNTAFTKLSSSPEEKTEVDAFNTSLASLISSVDRHDIESSRLAFVSSASALEKWVGLTGLIVQLKGL